MDAALALANHGRISSSPSLHFVSPQEWEVEYSRFFNFPQSLPSLNLKPLPKSKSRSGGTWLTASSLTLLRLRCPNSTVSLLSVSVPGLVYEEHFISNLHISLPRLSCVSQCSDSGSRAIFMSFRDFSNQIQKFALRFSTYSEVQTFLDNVKESSRNIMEIGVCDFACENSPSSLTVSPNAIQYGDEESNIGESVYALTFNEMVEYTRPQSLSNANSVISPALPPSFLDFLRNCSGNGQEEKLKLAMGSLTSDDELRLLDYLANASVSEMVNALVQPIPEFTVDSELLKCASNASFHDMLAKIEGAITDLGGDMSL